MVRFSTPDDPATGEGESGLAPVIPLFGAAAPASSPTAAPEWRSTWDDDADDHGDDGYDDGFGVIADGADACTAIERDIAEKNLTKRLRTRQLSVAEARAVLTERDLDRETVDAVLERFQDLGYLDDAALAEQLTHVGVERKGQGRKAIAQTLTKRGIPRDVADAALASLPDDDAERALEYARGKVASMARLDREAAVRRLAGQLARRGYPGGVALSAAKQALEESGSSSGVRFR